MGRHYFSLLLVPLKISVLQILHKYSSWSMSDISVKSVLLQLGHSFVLITCYCAGVLQGYPIPCLSFETKERLEVTREQRRGEKRETKVINACVLRVAFSYFNIFTKPYKIHHLIFIPTLSFIFL